MAKRKGTERVVAFGTGDVETGTASSTESGTDPMTGDTGDRPHEPRARSRKRKPPRPKCRGTSKRTGERCGQTPPAGQLVCQWHGGKAPQVAAKAAERLTLERAREAVETYGLARDISPTEALLEEVRWTAGHVDWLRQRVQETEQQALIWGTTTQEQMNSFGTGFEGADESSTTVTDAATPHMWLVLYREERKHLLNVCKAAIAAGIEERRVRLAESQGTIIAAVIRNILGDLGLTDEQWGLVSEVVPRHLRAVA